MTRTQTRAYGVIAPSSRQPLLEAMLRVFAWLVSNVVSTFRTIFNRRTRDWHTDAASEDQLPKSNDIQEGTTALFPPSVRSTGGGGSPRLRGETACRAEAQRRWEGAATHALSSPALHPRGTTTHSPEAENQDARPKAEHDPVGAANPCATLSLSFRAKARSAAEPEPKGDAHRHHNVRILGSRLRGNDSVGVRLITA